MKIAVLLFGHLRTYKQCYESLRQNLIDLYDCDVFMHTWDSLDHNTKTWHSYKVEGNISSLEDLEKELYDLYKLKNLKIEKQIVQDEGEILCQGNPISLFGMHSMLYSMKEANVLREKYQKTHNIRYDLVVIVRPDIKLLKPLIFENYENPQHTSFDMFNTSFYTAGVYKFTHLLNDFRFIGATDLLFWATPDTISDIYKHIDLIFNQIKNIETSKYGPEYSFVYAIQKLGYSPKLMNYLLNDCFLIVRGKDVLHQQSKKSLNIIKRIFHV